jgi:hypothetical protein
MRIEPSDLRGKPQVNSGAGVYITLKRTGWKPVALIPFVESKSTFGGTITPTPCPVCQLARSLVWRFSILIGRTIKTASRRNRTRA